MPPSEITRKEFEKEYLKYTLCARKMDLENIFKPWKTDDLPLVELISHILLPNPLKGIMLTYEAAKELYTEKYANLF